MNTLVAVIDIGSNSIKSLVAKSSQHPWGITPVYEETREVRLSQGISGTPPMIQPEAIQAGVQAIESLWLTCLAEGQPDATKIVATAAVRSATNGGEFLDAVEAATGHRPVVLSGDEEATGIAKGVLTDPVIGNQLNRFSLFDLGGGSLELARIEDRSITWRGSFPLGAVRLSEQFITDTSQPIPLPEQQAISNWVRQSLSQVPAQLAAPLVGCSGGLTILRAIRARIEGLPIRSVSGVFRRIQLDALGQRVLDSDLQTRIRELGLPPERADIFPAAFLVFRELLDLAGADQLLHSLHNLRFGLAWQLLHPDA